MPATIMIIGDNWKKPFYCYGSKNPDSVCAECVLRFKCFSGRGDTIELTIEKLKELNPGVQWRDGSTVETMCRFLVKNIVPKIINRENKKVAQLDFKNVSKINE